MYFLFVQLVEERELLKQELQSKRRAREDKDSITGQVKIYAYVYIYVCVCACMCVYVFIRPHIYIS